MWNRKDLKQKGKKTLKANYWTVIVVCFIIAIFTSEFGVSITGNWQDSEIATRQFENLQLTYENVPTIIVNVIETNIEDAIKGYSYIVKIHDSVVSFIGGNNLEGIVAIIFMIITLLAVIFFCEPLIVGGRRYFLKARENEETKISEVFKVFKDGYSNVVKIVLSKNIFVLLWSLTIIGGIIKNYEYRMIEYILAENPKIKRKEAFDISKNMMKGFKFKVFILDISFLLWKILSMFTLGLLNVLYINPYVSFTNVEVYYFLKANLEKNNK